MTEVIDAIKMTISNFNSGIFVLLSAICYLLIQLLRGKFGFSIPYITEKIESLKKEVKTILIVSLFVIAGITSNISIENFNFYDVFNGLIDGLLLGLTTIGARNTVKQITSKE